MSSGFETAFQATCIDFGFGSESGSESDSEFGSESDSEFQC